MTILQQISGKEEEEEEKLEEKDEEICHSVLEFPSQCSSLFSLPEELDLLSSEQRKLLLHQTPH